MEHDCVAFCPLSPYLRHIALSMGHLYEMQGVVFCFLGAYLGHVQLLLNDLYDMQRGSHLEFLART